MKFALPIYSSLINDSLCSHPMLTMLTLPPLSTHSIYWYIYFHILFSILIIYFLFLKMSSGWLFIANTFPSHVEFNYNAYF